MEQSQRANPLGESRPSGPGSVAASGARLAPSERLLRTFGGLLHERAWTPGRTRQGVRIAGFTSDHTAQVRVGGRKALLVSNIPMRAGRRGTRAARVDTRLSEHGRHYAPRNPLVPLTLPKRLAAGIRVPGLGLGVKPAGVAGRGARGRLLRGRYVFYAGVARSTDFLAIPTATGFETFWQLRSATSPARLSLRNTLPRGTTLRERGDIVEILRAGRMVGAIQPPEAFDADGRAVAVSQRLRGTDLELVVRHHGRARYPVLVDPTYQIYEGWDWRTGSDGLLGWKYRNNHPLIYGNYECDLQSLKDCDGGQAAIGLHVLAKPGWYDDGNYGQWYYKAPGLYDGAAYIRFIRGNNIRHSWRGSPTNSYAQVGIWSWRAFAYTAYQQVGEYGIPNFASLEAGVDPVTRAGTNVASADVEGGNEAIFNMRFSGSGNRATYSTLYVGGAELIMEDTQVPQITVRAVGHDPNRWYTGAEATRMTFDSADQGFGISHNEVVLQTSQGLRTVISENQPCTGKWDARCPYYATMDVPVPTGAMTEGINTIQALAYDAAGKGSDGNAHKYPLRIDHSAPTITLNGGLAGKENGVIAPGSYAISATAVDCTGTSDSQIRSGVKTITIDVDGNRQPLPFSDTSAAHPCSASSNPGTIALAPGEHHIEIATSDWVGLPAEKAFTVTVPPAAPTNSSPPAVTGTARNGGTVSVDPGSWDGAAPISYTYQWQRCYTSTEWCDDIPGAINRDYLVVAADVTRQLRARVEARNVIGASAVASSRTAPARDVVDHLRVVDEYDDSLEPDYVGPGIADFCRDIPEAETSDDCGEGAGVLDPVGGTTLSGSSAASGPSLPPRILPKLGYGLSDHIVDLADPSSEFRDPRMDELVQNGLRSFRLIVPWDLMTSSAPYYTDLRGRMDGWVHEIEALAARNTVQIADIRLLVSFEKRAGLPNDTDTTRPTPSAYDTAVSAFIDRYSPRVYWYTAWNEPNHAHQPTSVAASPANDAYRGARAAANFWDKLRSLCKSKAVCAAPVAGDFDDAAFNYTDLDSYMDAYIDRLDTTPSRWAWHGYGGKYTAPKGRVYFKKFLAHTRSESGASSKVWLTEQGMINQHDVCGGPYVERDQTDPAAVKKELENLFSLPDFNTRVSTYYAYSWRGDCFFDPGLVSWHVNEPGSTLPRARMSFSYFRDILAAAP